MLNKITSNPKLVFHLDCLGALLSAFIPAGWNGVKLCLELNLPLI